LLLIFPTAFIALLFPNGKPLSPRWRWLILFGISLCVAFIVFGTFVETFSLSSTQGVELWSVPNPLGFISEDAFPIAAWVILLGLFVVLSLASLFLRYRRTSALEREQIKWLLYACALFVAFYIPSLLLAGIWQTVDTRLLAIFFIFSLYFIPISIGIAILKYRLWDIDLIIRRTLVYGALTITVALVFFGGVTLLQQVFAAFTGIENSPAAIVISTLFIAALFNPLRKRIQTDIDRRFYRKKYDAQKALDQFAISARNEVALEELSQHLISVVIETVQPIHAVLWLKPGRKR
jgi:hypothetical protein